MEFLTQITFGDLVLSFLTVCVIHESLVAFLPDHIAGPGGWLIDTGEDEA